MEFGLKGTSRICHGRHGEVGIVEFGFTESASSLQTTCCGITESSVDVM